MYQREINTLNMKQTSRFLAEQMLQSVATFKHQTPRYKTRSSKKSQCLFFFKYFSLCHRLSNHGIVCLSICRSFPRKRKKKTYRYDFLQYQHEGQL